MLKDGIVISVCLISGVSLNLRSLDVSLVIVTLEVLMIIIVMLSLDSANVNLIPQAEHVVFQNRVILLALWINWSMKLKIQGVQIMTVLWKSDNPLVMEGRAHGLVQAS
uniref:Uncharacterized protein n=1 Tax=Cacopsylla melanoneura TaxID=428564 RepID=A0A8D8TDN6_9HEMI